MPGSRCWSERPSWRPTRPAATAASSTPACTTSRARSRRASAARARPRSRRYAEEQRHPVRALRQARRRPRRDGAAAPSSDCASVPRPTACPASRSSGRSGSREIEPHVRAVRGAVEPGDRDHRLPAGRPGATRTTCARPAGTIHPGHTVLAIRADGDGIAGRDRPGTVRARAVIACAGLWADEVAAMTPGAGIRADRPVPRRLLHADAGRARRSCTGLIYPVPDPRFPFLGVHFTRRIDGEVWAGPNAVLAFARTGYRRRDVDVRDLAGTLGSRGFLRLAARFWRTGAARDVARLVEGRVRGRAPAVHPGHPRRPADVRAVGHPGPGGRPRTARWSTTSGSAATTACCTSSTRPRRRPRRRWPSPRDVGGRAIDRFGL